MPEKLRRVGVCVVAVCFFVCFVVVVCLFVCFCCCSVVGGLFLWGKGERERVMLFCGRGRMLFCCYAVFNVLACFLARLFLRVHARAGMRACVCMHVCVFSSRLREIVHHDHFAAPPPKPPPPSLPLSLSLSLSLLERDLVWSSCLEIAMCARRQILNFTFSTLQLYERP